MAYASAPDTYPAPNSALLGRSLRAPAARQVRYNRPEDLYLKQLLEVAREVSERPLRIVSAGSGNGELEIGLASALVEHGVDFQFACLDLNHSLLATAYQEADKRGLLKKMTFTVADCNRDGLGHDQDVILVNQFFHHIEKLEWFCAQAKTALAFNGRLLTSDVIGRNGHLLWPDVRIEVDHFWEQLPKSRKVDRSSGRLCEVYQEVNHAAYSSEGIRAQNIVACLSACFDFQLFLSYGAIIVPFIERRFGGNFDPESREDCEFIDRVQQRDAALFDEVRIPASNMLAVLRHKGEVDQTHFDPVSPQQHLALVQAQLRKLNG